MKKNPHIFLFFLLSSIEAIGAAFWLVSLPAESGNALAFGFSLQRLLMIAAMIIIGFACFVLLYFIVRKSDFTAKIGVIFKNSWLVNISFALLLISWVSIFLPDYQWGRFAGYKSRLFPIIVWLLLVGFQACISGILLQKKNLADSIKTVLSAQPGLMKSWIVFSSILTGLLPLVAFFRIGLIPDIIYWNNINVPLLGIQVFGVVIFSFIFIRLLAGSGFFRGEKRDGFSRLFPDLVIFLLIWGLAVVLWTQTEGPRSYFAPGPYPPNGESYPFSDAAGYDMAAHLAAIGGGLGTTTYVDKPLYVAFLGIIYLLAGSRMSVAVGMQVAVIALLPAMLYLLGKKLHSRLAGLIAAGLIIFREINNIDGTLWVLSANSKVFMTETMVSLLLAFFVYFLTAWVDKPEKYWFLMASGGSLGLAGLVRLNPFILLPFIPAAIFFLFWKKWKKILIYSSIFVAFFAASVLPWMIQSYMVHNNFIFFTSTVRWVVLPQRTFYALNQPASTPPIEVTPTPAPQKQTATLLPLAPTAEPAQTAAKPVDRTWNKITGVSRYVSAHFMHNLINTVAVFPTRLTFDSLEKTIKSPGSFWDPEWNGNLPSGEAGLLCANLAVIALGLAVGWSRRRWAGLVPAGFLLIYSLATAAARTSSGRYFLPADWVGIAYFSLGISQLVCWVSLWWRGKDLEGGGEKKNKQERISIGKSALLLGLFVFIGSTPILLDRLIPQRYAAMNKTSMIDALEEKGVLASLPISKSDLITFLDSPDAVIYHGLGLYPRFYEMNKGEPDQFSEARGLPYPRLVITVIGPDFRINGILPLQKTPDELPNGSDVIAIGCNGNLNIDWFALVVEGPQPQILLRSPQAEWTCPARVPVCDDNRNCQ